MNPDKTLAEFLDCCANSRRVGAREAIQELEKWLLSGGHLPADPRPAKPATDQFALSTADKLLLSTALFVMLQRISFPSLQQNRALQIIDLGQRIIDSIEEP